MKHEIDYKVIKSNIIKACRSKDKSSIGKNNFSIDYEKLNNLVSDYGLTVINTNLKHSDMIRPSDIVSISEYFKDKQLAWFDSKKQFMYVIFVKTDAIDENLTELLNFANEDLEFENVDRVAAVAQIVSNYPCYFATVVSYESNDPIRFDKPSYMIGCRANTVAVKQDVYKYNEKDM